MSKILHLSQLRIEYNAELKQLERMVEEAIRSNQPITSKEILSHSRKVDALLRSLMEENELNRFSDPSEKDRKPSPSKE